jgi:hypothetical protein
MQDVIYKICCRCKEEKELDQFNKNRSRNDGFNSSCKVCDKESKSKSYKINQEKILKNNSRWRHENAEIIKERAAKYRQENAEIIKERKAKYRQENAEIIKERKAKYWAENGPKFKEDRKKYRSENSQKIKEQKRRDINKFRQTKALWHIRLHDRYIVSLIKKQFGLSEETIKEHPELIESYRMQLKMKRFLKHKKDEDTKTS